MSWSNVGSNTGAPKNISVGGVSANGDSLFQNVQSGAIVSGLQLGVFAVDAAEKANTTGEGRGPQHAGWVVRKVGTGGVDSITITTPGAGYSNGFLTFSGGGGSGANASYFVNGAGNITSVIVNSRGSNYNTAPTVAATGANTAVAVLAVVASGRIGRKQYETIVAMGSMTAGANTDNTYFPE